MMRLYYFLLGFVFLSLVGMETGPGGMKRKGEPEEIETKKQRTEEQAEALLPKLLIIQVAGGKKMMISQALYTLSPVLVAYAKFKENVKKPYNLPSVSVEVFELLLRLLEAEKNITTKNVEMVKQYAQRFKVPFEDIVHMYEKGEQSKVLQILLVKGLENNPKIDELVNELLETAHELQLNTIVRACAEIIGKNLTTVLELETARNMPEEIQKMLIFHVMPTQQTVRQLLKWVSDLAFEREVDLQDLRILLGHCADVLIMNTPILRDEVVREVLIRDQLIHKMLKEYIIDNYWPLLVRVAHQVSHTPSHLGDAEDYEAISKLAVVQDTIVGQYYSPRVAVWRMPSLQKIKDIWIGNEGVFTLNNQKQLYTFDNNWDDGQAKLKMWDLNVTPVARKKVMSYTENIEGLEHIWTAAARKNDVVIAAKVAMASTLEGVFEVSIETIIGILDKGTLKLINSIPISKMLSRSITSVSQVHILQERYALIELLYKDPSKTENTYEDGAVLIDLNNGSIVGFKRGFLYFVVSPDQQNILVLTATKAVMLTIEECISMFEKDRPFDQVPAMNFGAVMQEIIMAGEELSFNIQFASDRFLICRNQDGFEIFDLRARRRAFYRPETTPSSRVMDFICGDKMIIKSIYSNPMLPQKPASVDLDEWRAEHWKSDVYTLQVLQPNVSLDLMHMFEILAEQYRQYNQ